MDPALARPVSSEIPRGSKSSRGAWVTVLRQPEFVNLPSREACSGRNTLRLFCQCIFTNWNHLVVDIGFGLSTGLR